VTPRAFEDLHERAVATLYRLREGDLIEVKWLDACKVTNVKRLQNKVYATYKKVVGYFWCILNDKLYGQEYLILYTEETDFNKRTIVSIPVAVVMNVQVLRRPVKTVSDAGDPYLEGGYYSKYMKREGGIGEIAETAPL